MSFDLIATYFPSITDIAPADVQNMRLRITNFWQVAWPDQDTRPGSVFGDSVITPLAYFLEMMETALTRFRSDLTLENVAGGVIWDCPFVTDFLGNFAVQDTTGLFATGMLRLTFNANVRTEIDRGCLFQFNGTLDNTFGFRLFNPGSVIVLPVGAAGLSGGNSYALIQITDTTYAVDIPVIGQMATPVVAGDSATLTLTIPNLVSAAALVDFNSGSGTTSIPQLAEQTRTAFWSASMNTRYSARQYLLKAFQDLVTVSPVMPGDAEMLRGAINPLGFAALAADIYVRSSNPKLEESLIIPLTYIDNSGLGLADCYFGPLVLAGVPVRLEGFVATNYPAVNLDNGLGSLTVYSQTTDNVRAPGIAAGFTNLETLWVKINMPRDQNGNPLVVATVAADGSQSALFTVNYSRDPLIPVISDFLLSADNKAAGISVLVKGFIPFTLASLTVRYTRKPGTMFNATQARTEIYNYLTGLGYPDKYTDAKIGDSMFYAGATSMIGVTCSGILRWTIASALLPYGVNPPSDGVSAATIPPMVTVGNSAAFSTVYQNALSAAGPRNTAFLIDQANIIFDEVC